MSRRLPLSCSVLILLLLLALLAVLSIIISLQAEASEPPWMATAAEARRSNAAGAGAAQGYEDRPTFDRHRSAAVAPDPIAADAAPGRQQQQYAPLLRERGGRSSALRSGPSRQGAGRFHVPMSHTQRTRLRLPTVEPSTFHVYQDAGR